MELEQQTLLPHRERAHTQTLLSAEYLTHCEITAWFAAL